MVERGGDGEVVMKGMRSSIKLPSTRAQSTVVACRAVRPGRRSP